MSQASTLGLIARLDERNKEAALLEMEKALKEELVDKERHIHDLKHTMPILNCCRELHYVRTLFRLNYESWPESEKVILVTLMLEMVSDCPELLRRQNFRMVIRDICLRWIKLPVAQQLYVDKWGRDEDFQRATAALVDLEANTSPPTIVAEDEWADCLDE